MMASQVTPYSRGVASRWPRLAENTMAAHQRGDADDRSRDRAADRQRGPACAGLQGQPDAHHLGGRSDAPGQRDDRPAARGEDRNGAWRAVAGRRPPRRGGGADHRDQHRGEPADREDPAVGGQAWVWLCHPGQAHRQQRRQGKGECHRQAGRSGPDRGRPADADRHQLAAARPERSQGGVVTGFGKAQAGQYLSQDEDADSAEEARRAATGRLPAGGSNARYSPTARRAGCHPESCRGRDG